jgi:hypothetical protein
LDQNQNDDGLERARLLAEQVRLQQGMIELLNEQVRRQREQAVADTEEIRELKRLIRVRDDHIMLLRQQVPLLTKVVRHIRGRFGI